MTEADIGMTEHRSKNTLGRSVPIKTKKDVEEDGTSEDGSPRHDGDFRRHSSIYVTMHDGNFRRIYYSYTRIPGSWHALWPGSEVVKKATLDKSILSNYRPVSSLTYVDKLRRSLSLSITCPSMDWKSNFSLFTRQGIDHSTESALLKIHYYYYLLLLLLVYYFYALHINSKNYLPCLLFVVMVK